MLTQRYPFHRETQDTHRLKIRRVIDAMHENLAVDLSLEDLADLAHVSPFHFNRIFSGLVGIPPRFFLAMLRIEAAKRLLVDTDWQVTRICSEVGFKSLGTFSRRFKDLVGTSPRRFRSLAALDLRQVLDGVLQWSRLPRVLHPLSLADQAGAPPGFEGLIFVGLFVTPVPTSRPVACTVLSEPGRYVLPHVPDGVYYLCATGMTLAADVRSYLLSEDVLRAGSPWEPVVVRNSRIAGPTRLSLRPPVKEDPPILMVLPPLWERRRDESSGFQLSGFHRSDGSGRTLRFRATGMSEETQVTFETGEPKEASL